MFFVCGGVGVWPTWGWGGVWTGSWWGTRLLGCGGETTETAARSPDAAAVEPSTKEEEEEELTELNQNQSQNQNPNCFCRDHDDGRAHQEVFLWKGGGAGSRPAVNRLPAGHRLSADGQRSKTVNAVQRTERCLEDKTKTIYKLCYTFNSTLFIQPLLQTDSRTEGPNLDPQDILS